MNNLVECWEDWVEDILKEDEEKYRWLIIGEKIYENGDIVSRGLIRGIKKEKVCRG